MRHIYITILFIFIKFICLGQTEKVILVVHGGAGVILKENMPAELEKVYTQKLEEALKAGYQVLKKGGSSLDAVEQTIIILEDSPLFNAGKGAVLTSEGKAELDASIMDGKTLKAGAVAGVTIIKNPIQAARRVMDNSPHVMLAGKGAEQFATEQKLTIVEPDYFLTDRRKKQLKESQKTEEPEKKKKKSTGSIEDIKNNKFGTVGCVALDQQGNLAAGTSTGGMNNKRWGRVGDSPVIGAGTYADNQSCGVSATGWGEFFIRLAVAHDIAALVAYKKLSVKDAAEEVIKKVGDAGGSGGVIVLDTQGNVAMPFNTEGMFRGYITESGKIEIKIYK